MKENLLPYFDERKEPVTMLILHSFASKSFEDSCHKHRLSAHYTIDENGEITKYIPEDKRAWHAGLGSWREFKDDLNSRSIGIEIKNPTLGQTPFAEAQIEKLIIFCNKLIKKHHIKPENIIGHSDSAPTRKPDPGHMFPWKRLAKEGIGLWYQIKNADKIAEDNLQKLLEIIGYDTTNPEAAAYAFCRHYLPEYINPDLDIQHLVDNVLPDEFAFMKEDKFLRTLKAVAYTFLNLSKKP